MLDTRKGRRLSKAKIPSRAAAGQGKENSEPDISEIRSAGV